MTNLRSLLLVACSLLLATTTNGFLLAAPPTYTATTRSFSLATRSNTHHTSSNRLPKRLLTTTSQKVSVADHDDAKNDDDDDEDNRVFFPAHYVGLAFDKYVDWCHRKPFRTKSVSAMFILLLGDVMAQAFEASSLGVPFRLNMARTRGFALCGLLFEGPWMHFWYEQVWK